MRMRRASLKKRFVTTLNTPARQVTLPSRVAQANPCVNRTGEYTTISPQKLRLFSPRDVKFGDAIAMPLEAVLPPSSLVRRTTALCRGVQAPVATAAWCIASAADIPPQLTLPEALNLALTNSTVLREAMAQFDETSGKYLQSRSALLPQLGIFARQSLQTISLQGYGIDIPGLSQQSQQGKVGPFGSMDARAVLRQEDYNTSRQFAVPSESRPRRTLINATHPAPPPGAVDVRPAYIYNPGLVTAWHYVTGVMSIIMFINASLVASALAVKEKETGTIEQLMMTPAQTVEMLLANPLRVASQDYGERPGRGFSGALQQQDE
jgi:hypothetical protein